MSIGALIVKQENGPKFKKGDAVVLTYDKEKEPLEVIYVRKVGDEYVYGVGILTAVHQNVKEGELEHTDRDPITGEVRQK